jgi:hypothetical protein
MNFWGIVFVVGLLWLTAHQANKPITAKRGEKTMGMHYMIDARYKQKSDRSAWQLFFWIIIIGLIVGLIQNTK